MNYKTFEDMKNDIPEGATHYQNESEDFFFAWFNFNTMQCLCLGKWSSFSPEFYPDGEIKPIPQTETPEEKEALDSMASGEAPTSGQDVFIAQMNTLAGVESQRYFIHQYWCNSGHQKQLLELGILFTDKEKAIEKTKSLLGIPTETPQQRKERERLEAAYDLYLTQCLTGECDQFTYEEFIKEEFLVKIWLSIVDKTGYRKAK